MKSTAATASGPRGVERGPLVDGDVEGAVRAPQARSGAGAATAARYLMLLVTLLLAGGYAGHQVYLVAFADGDAARECAAQAETAFPVTDPVTQSDQAFAQAEAMLACLGDRERAQAAAVGMGALVALGLGLLAAVVLQAMLLRRAGPFRPATRYQQRAEVLAGALGLRRAPEIVYGGPQLREPFTVATPRGRIRVVLARGVAGLPPAEADAVLTHELAHVSARDVQLVWLTRGVWWVLPAALLAPVAVAVAYRLNLLGAPSDGAGIGFGHWAEHTGRSAVLLLVAAVVSFRVLRCREHLADLRAAEAVGPAGLATLLDRQPEPVAARLWRRLTATHPTPARRSAALHAPDTVLGSSTKDAVLSGLLAGYVLTLLQLSIGVWRLGTPGAANAMLLGAAAPAGLLLVATWGATVWRSAVTEPPGRHGSWVPAAALAPAAGMALALATSPWGPVGGVSVPLVLVWLTAGAGALGVALIRSCAALGGAGRWPAGAAVTVLLLVALAVGQSLATGKSPGQLLNAWLYAGVVNNPLDPVTPYALALIAALAWWAALAGTRTGITSTRAVLAVIAATSVAAVVTTERAGLLRTEDPLQFISHIGWAPAAAGVGCLLVLHTTAGRHPMTLSLAAAVTATAVTGIAIWISHLTEWPHPALAAELIGRAGTVHLLLTLLVLAPLLALLPTRRTPLAGARAWATPPLAAAVTTGLVLLLLVL